MTLTLHPASATSSTHWAQKLARVFDDEGVSLTSLGLSPRFLSLGSKEDRSGRLKAVHAVQLSACSDSVLSVPACRRTWQHSAVSSSTTPAGPPVLTPPQALNSAAVASSSLSSQLQQIHTWDRFDVFRVAELTHGCPLRTVTLAIMEALGLLNGWKLDRRKVEAFLAAAEQAYGQDNPYHNSTHAADVVQAAFLMLRSMQRPQFTKLEVFGLVLAAVVHDLAHPGVTNDFLTRTHDPLAAAHGAASVNEKHHVATAFSIAAKEELNIFSGLSAPETEQVRDFMRGAVLATDMAHHSSLTEQLAPVRQRLAEGRPCNGEQRALLLRVLLHAADLSNPARPLPIGALWGQLVAREFLAQGDREKELGLPISPPCNRCTVVISTSQLRFIDMFLRPLLAQVRGVLGEGLRAQLLSRLMMTEAYWREHQSNVQLGKADPHTVDL